MDLLDLEFLEPSAEASLMRWLARHPSLTDVCLHREQPFSHEVVRALLESRLANPHLNIVIQKC